MVTQKRLRLELHPDYLVRLQDRADAAKVSVDAYASGVLIKHALGDDVGGNQSKRPTGRPAVLQPDDLPAAVERAPTTSGFAGVTKRGRFWLAKLGGDHLGQFSTPELAATIRYYAMHGFRVGRGAYLAATGLDEASAADLASRVPYGHLPAPAADPSTVAGAVPMTPVPAKKMPISRVLGNTPCDWCGEVIDPNEDAVDVDGKYRHALGCGSASRVEGETTADPAGEGDSAAGSGESREGDPAPSTLPQTLSGLRLERQAPSTKKDPLFGIGCCPTCGDDLPNVKRKHKQLCLLCSNDYEDWLKLPAGGQAPLPPANGVYTNSKGSPVGESFKDYVTRIRGL